PGFLFVVNSTGDGSNTTSSLVCDADDTTPGEQCTLRAAIELSNLSPGVDEIRFDLPINEPACVVLGTCIIDIFSPLPDLVDSVNIQGPGADHLTVRRNTSTGLFFRIFTVPASAADTISGLTISNGGPLSCGGAISNDGDLTLSDSTISGNASLTSLTSQVGVG